jgi:hypothetical protein
MPIAQAIKTTGMFQVTHAFLNTRQYFTGMIMLERVNFHLEPHHQSRYQTAVNRFIFYSI